MQKVSFLYSYISLGLAKEQKSVLHISCCLRYKLHYISQILFIVFSCTFSIRILSNIFLARLNKLADLTSTLHGILFMNAITIPPYIRPDPVFTHKQIPVSSIFYTTHTCSLIISLSVQHLFSIFLALMSCIYTPLFNFPIVPIEIFQIFQLFPSILSQIA